jgi:DNA processing protein
VDPGHNDIRQLLHLTLTPELGPIRIARLLETFGSPDAVLGLSASQLTKVKGIGRINSDTIARGMQNATALVDKELDAAAALGARLIPRGSPDYPALLANIPSAPPLLYVRGTIDANDADRYPLAIVGSRRCTAYGVEQADRFASVLASSGITIVSGGAKGIDASAHRGALKAGGRTIVVQGCGLKRAYPPDHADLYERIVKEGRGAIVSELPLDTAPTSENFPARNRIISGLSLGVMVIEAADRSGSLITARIALDDHAREVFILPGRVDSPSSTGSLDMLKRGEGQMVTEPGDILAALETPARHLHGGTHTSRYVGDGGLFGSEPDTDPALQSTVQSAPHLAPAPNPTAAAVLAVIHDEATFDQIVERTGLSAAAVRAELTMLEIQRRIERRGSTFIRRP